MFARLRGIPESLISQAVEAEVARLDLSKHASKQCGKYRYMAYYYTHWNYIIKHVRTTTPDESDQFHHYLTVEETKEN